ncbi:hypothetical protein LK996_05870 [Lysobacter sp. A6]|uniref:Lipoprotein n=1 Tax=Noviluteimonas lactosilytica TaxID=2888523 RepID=A0ABS8JG62_9GAMM|nr:hypothetical protein [Lysobacter lactosilyticus]MCC8362600.1 hypothetical protein [Lysobacter lactosilyticus]
MYKQMIGTMVLVAALAACSDKSAQQAPKQTAAEGAAALATTPAVAPDSNEFPGGFVPDFKYQIRSKKTEDQGAERYRKLVIEFQQVDAAEIDKRIESKLAALGYRRYKAFQEPNGAFVGDYGRNSGHRITATTTQAQPGMTMLNADSRGTVYFVWKPE